MNVRAMDTVKAIAGSGPQASPRTLGAILVDAGRLTVEQAERVMQLQRDQNLRFGDAATRLGLIGPEDLQFALAAQFGYHYLRRGDTGLSPELGAAFDPLGAPAEQLRALRSQLMLRWLGGEAGQRALAVVGPARGDGRSHLAANLAVVFAQLGQRTLLIDADLRNGRQHQLFNLDNRSGLSRFLADQPAGLPVQSVPGLPGLGVVPCGPTPPNPLELLARDGLGELLGPGAGYDVVLLDTPASRACADAQAVAARAGGALMVLRSQRTPLADARSLARALAETGTGVVGSVLKRF